ncbi:MAG: di-trans,poly-cis-decaprenylcistransferase [Myxococcales bacterium]|nr:di-trans,poly-cis-decaprenylcistransferase [Myxococcales bacterium]
MTVHDKQDLLDCTKVIPPANVAIIMDGNGRWAQACGLPRVEGHRHGAKVVRDITEYCREVGVRNLYLYAFSQQNWDRPADEVQALMTLLEEYLWQEIPTMRENGIKLGVMGDKTLLPSNTLRALNQAMEATKHCREMNLVLAISYGARDELIRAAKKLAAEGTNPEHWTPAMLSGYLDTAPYGDPDLILRTGGELRLSNFLLWQASYAELFFTDTPWPSFRRTELESIFNDYQTRQRRYGQTPAQTAQLTERRVGRRKK